MYTKIRLIHFFKMVPNCLAQFPAEPRPLILHWIALIHPLSKKCHVNYFTLIKHRTKKENVDIICFKVYWKPKSLLASIFKFHTWKWYQPISFSKKKNHLLSVFLLTLKNIKISSFLNCPSCGMCTSWQQHSKHRPLLQMPIL